MIIKNQPKVSWDKQVIIKRCAAIFFVGLLLWCAYALFNNGNSFFSKNQSFSTSFEHISGESFKGSNGLFSGSGFQVEEMAKTGRHSILVDSDSSRYTAFLEIETPHNLYGHIKVWTKIKEGKVFPVINVNGKEKNVFNRSSTKNVEKDGDWTLIELWFLAPEEGITDNLIFNLEVEGKGAIYFDDLEIKFQLERPSHLYADFKPKEINLRIDEQAFSKIKKIRDEAVDHGILITNDDNWVSAKLEDGEEVLDAKIRLKGDWADHLKGNKWSYRMKFKKDHTWNRLKTVSFQSPEVRNFVHEWVLHQLWEKEDILTTRYDFISLNINGESRGVYAYEEHFEKQLLEYKSRREGPILRFDEAAIWTERSRSIHSFNYFPPGVIDETKQFGISEIGVFGEGKIYNSEVLKRHYVEARKLMAQYQRGNKPAHEVFDLEQVAKYYAICDLMDAHHATIWHNERFYYNPVINKLEVIGYDGNIGLMHMFSVFQGEKFLTAPKGERKIQVFSNLATDTTFVRKYIHYLDKFSQKDYVNQFIQEVEPQARLRESFLKIEYDKAIFDPYLIRDKANRIQNKIWPYNENSLIVFTEKNNVSRKILSLKNKHCIPFEIIGTGTSKDNMNYQLSEKVVVWPGKAGLNAEILENLEVSSNTKYVFYKGLGLDSIFYSTINPLKSPQGQSSSQDIFSNVQLDTTGIYQVKDDYIFFKKGKKTISKNIIIPKGYKVVFDSGTELDFINGAGFISHSSVEMYGTETHPIKITSSDKSAKGFTILQAKEESLVNYTTFNNFDTWNYKNWVLTGAVTFYESDVKINSCLITSNTCEDALNIIRSKFVIDDLTISNTFGDGFDADFCEGEITNSRFLDTGNDGMDFSGSKIYVKYCKVEGSGDKGLSGGEESLVYIKNFIVKDAVLGVAAKDLSVLHITGIELESCKQGYAAFRKKPEYGKGSIYVTEHKDSNVELLYNIEEESILMMDGKLIQ